LGPDEDVVLEQQTRECGIPFDGKADAGLDGGELAFADLR
jgi:hypothetical protein